ncbi:YraN family protein [Shewanella sp.]|uniref:YraN family protein n=1 Tax=Shewanella sp. TaxID=50422 RepID=UPI003A985F6B
MDIGKDAEQRARRYLAQRGLTFVAANVRYSFGELDLVMRDGKHWVFVEVKYRSNRQFGGAVQALGAAQVQRLRQAAACYLQQHRIDAPCRFDLVAIDKQQIDWVRGAF